jgi:hypothetical protein
MSIYIYNTDTLKSRIKNLKKSLLACEGIDNLSLGTCRDLVAQSLDWNDWNDLYLGHQKRGNADFSIYDSPNYMMFNGRWFHGEQQKRDARLRLAELIHTTFQEKLGDTLSWSLAEVVWPQTAFEFSKTSTVVHTNAIAPEYWRDGLLIDSESRKSFFDFRQKVLLPHVAKYGGVVFCTPGELKNILSYFNDQEEQAHHVVVDEDYGDLFNKNDLQPSSILSRLSWEDNENNSLKDVIKHLLSLYVEGRCLENGVKISPDDIKTFLNTQFSTENTHALKIPVSQNLASEVLGGKVAESLGFFFDRLINTNYLLPPLSVTDIPHLKKPVIMVTHSDSLLAHSVLSALMSHFYDQQQMVQKGQLSVSSSTPPKLLVSGYTDQLTFPGLAASTIYSGAANWSVVLPQNMNLDRRYKTTEMPMIVANIGNIVRIEPDTLRNKLFKKSQAKWFTLRNSHLDVEDTMRAMAEYHYDPQKTEELMPSINLRWK